MIFMGSSTCPFSNHSTLPRLIEDAKLNLQRKALDLGLPFNIIGMSIDWVTSDGIAHLDKSESCQILVLYLTRTNLLAF